MFALLPPKAQTPQILLQLPNLPPTLHKRLDPHHSSIRTPDGSHGHIDASRLERLDEDVKIVGWSFVVPASGLDNYDANFLARRSLGAL